MSKDITDFEGANIIDVRDVTDRVEELRDQRTDRWVAGWNMPGYTPDNEPAEFDDCDDARAYIEEALRDRAGDAMLDETRSNEETDAEEAALLAVADHLKELQEKVSDADFGQTVAGMHYFITQDGTMGLDDEQQQELAKLEDLLNSLAGYGDDHQWEGARYPRTLISDDHFEDYMDQYLEDIGHTPTKDLPDYMTATIDYSTLQQDYGSVEFEGTTYWYR